METHKFIKKDLYHLKKLSDHFLLEYLRTRGIQASIAQKYCKEISFKNREKDFKMIAFPNTGEGYALLDPRKGKGKKWLFILPNTYSYVPGRRGKVENICTIFMDFIDFLSFLSDNYLRGSEKFIHTMDFVILNSPQNLHEASPIIEGYEAVWCCLPHDKKSQGILQTLSLLPTHVTDASVAYLESHNLNDHIRGIKFHRNHESNEMDN